MCVSISIAYICMWVIDIARMVRQPWPMASHGHGLLPARSILTAHGMALEEHGSPEAQLDARDVNGVLPGKSVTNLWKMENWMLMMLHVYTQE